MWMRMIQRITTKTRMEFMQFTGKLLVERSGLGARSTVKENEYFCHCYVRSDGLAAVSVTDSEYQARVAMSMMTRVLDDFTSKVHPTQWAQIKSDKDCMYTTLPELLAKWQNPREADPSNILNYIAERSSMRNKPGDIITPDCIRGIIGEGMPQRRHHDLRGNLYVKFDVAFPNDHFLEDDTKYKMIAAFPPVRKVAYPSNCEEVSLMEYDEKRYRGDRGGGQAYEEDGSDEEMGGHHGPQVQCAQS
ncbi:unnamed protein product [Cylicocyclus nassatus]|uniref:Longin domain-containing protein n=1 Tax=Cylicocyclus nassatus TaxID=53992 RepID=A0AA36HG76_CYLNA|nr:unnamed protein product [Cylicocyclus nassatus]